MIKRIILIGVILSASLGGSRAQEAPDGNEKCIGPMCLLTPIYRLGKIVMPAESVPPPAPAAPPAAMADPPRTSDRAANAKQPEPLSPGADQSATGGEHSLPTAQDKYALSQTVHSYTRSSSTITQFRPKLQARRHETRPQKHLAYNSVSGDLWTRAGTAAVTVSVAEPEMGRLLALAAVIKKPSIALIPDAGFGPGCSADFVVDTLSNPARRGPAIPLFSESLIILARKDVSSVRELRGRQVSFGPSSGSGERVAQRLFKSLDIPVRELPLDIDNALDGLALGDVDAVALLAPRGYGRLAHHDAQLHLLGLDAGSVPPEGLRVTRINPASYFGGAWPERSLSVVAVDAVLSPNPQSTRHASAMSLYAALDRRASQLAQNGFDLLGDGSPVMTMRSVAKDAEPALVTPVRADRGFAQKGCGT